MRCAIKVGVRCVTIICRPTGSSGTATPSGLRISADPAPVNDVKLAIGWLYSNIGRYGGDETRIYVGGHSSGAILAASVGVDRAWLAQTGIPKETLRGIVAVSALYDLRLKNPADSEKVFWSVYAPTRDRQ